MSHTSLFPQASVGGKVSMPNPENGLAKFPPPPSQDFVAGLSVILRGTIDDRLNWAFNLYDLNKDGCITKEVQGPLRATEGARGVLGGVLGGSVQRALIQNNVA